MRYRSSKQGGGVFSCAADAVIDAASTDVIKAHMLERNASKFRDVKKYSKFAVDADGVVRVKFPAKVGFFSFTQKFCKRATRDSIHFWTPEDSMARIRGSWKFKDLGDKTLVEFKQIVKVPGWASILPIESYIRGRVVRMMEDTANL